LNYSLLAYRMAYLKVHFPAEFYAAQLKVNISDESKLTGILKAIKQQNISLYETRKNVTAGIDNDGKIFIGKAGVDSLKRSIQYTFFNDYTGFEYMARSFLTLVSLLKKLGLKNTVLELKKEIDELWELRHNGIAAKLQTVLNENDFETIIPGLKRAIAQKNKAIEQDVILNLIRTEKMERVKEQIVAQAARLRDVEQMLIKQPGATVKPVWEVTCKACNHTFLATDTANSLSKIVCPSCGNTKTFDIRKK